MRQEAFYTIVSNIIYQHKQWIVELDIENLWGEEDVE